MRLAVSGGQPLFTLGLLMFALSSVDSVFTVEPQYQHRYFLFLSKVSFEGHTKSLKEKPSCWSTV